MLFFNIPIVVAASFVLITAHISRKANGITLAYILVVEDTEGQRSLSPLLNARLPDSSKQVL
jgi:hypothetical protein